MGSSAIWLNLTGLDQLDIKTHSEIVVRIRHVLEPLCKAAGKTLTITKGPHRGDLNLDFDSDTPPDNKGNPCGGFGGLGEDAGEQVVVRAHQNLRVCGPVDPRTGRRDLRRVLTTSWLLGPALATTALHELGHFIARLDHLEDPNNIMSTGESQPKVADRTMRTQQKFWAGNLTFNAQLKTEQWLGGITTVRVPVSGQSGPGTPTRPP
jgi:hypothetical protein